MSTKDTESNVSFQLSSQQMPFKPPEVTLFQLETEGAFSGLGFETLDEMSEEMEVDEPLVSKRHSDSSNAFHFH